MQDFRCSLCSYTSESYDRFVSHVVRLHRHDPNFIVYCSMANCSYSSKTWGAFKSHMSRKHRKLAEKMPTENDIDTDANDDDSGGLEYLTPTPPQQQLDNRRGRNAAFALALESRHNLSQSSVDDVIESTSLLIEQHVALYKNRVRAEIVEQGLNAEFLDEIAVEPLLNELGSHKKRDTFYEKNLGYIAPSPVRLGSKFVTVTGNLVKKDVLGYRVPFKDSLQSLLQMPEVWKYVNNPHTNTEEYMYDVCDGSYLQSHPLFMRNAKALQILQILQKLDWIH